MMTSFKTSVDDKGNLHIDAGDRCFQVQPHPGRDSARTRRQVQKLMLPKSAELIKAREAIVKQMTADEKKQLAELEEKLQALGEGASDAKQNISDQMDELFARYEDKSAMAIAGLSMYSMLNVDEEDFLDTLLFKHSLAAVKSDRSDASKDGWGPLTPLSVSNHFDAVFRGKYSNLIEKIRNEIIAFNGFLEQ